MMWGGLILPCSHLTTRLEGVTITDKTLFKHSQSKHKHNIVFLKWGKKRKKFFFSGRCRKSVLFQVMLNNLILVSK